MQAKIETFGDESSETNGSGDDRERESLVVDRIQAREDSTHTPGQGTAIDRVNAARRKADAFPIEEWPTQLIELHLFDLGHIAATMETRGEVAGHNCEKFARKGEALHQDFIAELQAREHWSRDDRQYLTNMWGNVCGQVRDAQTPGYTGKSCYFDVLRDLVAVDPLADGEEVSA
jgi:hypothetical protein